MNNSTEADNDTIVLLLQVPRTNDKKELAAEQMLASLHGLLTFPSNKLFQPSRRVRISFEIAVINKRIGFYVCVPNYLKEFVEEQIYAQYPTVQISEVADYAAEQTNAQEALLATEMKLSASDVLPIKTFQSFEVDPLAAITATLAKFEPHEEAWIQLIIQPALSNWHKRSEKYVTSVRSGSPSGSRGLVGALWTPPEQQAGGSGKLADFQQARASGAEEKSHKLAFETTLRIIYKGAVSTDQANLRLQSIMASYRQFNTTYLNGFQQTKASSDATYIKNYQSRTMAKRKLLLNIEEIATLYHLPHTSVETPYLLWASSQTAEPPANLPVVTEVNKDLISPMAAANFRGKHIAFGLPRSDRGRHLYILGQTGVGKSGLLELLTIADINSPFGFAVIDPHGDYALNILRRIPAERAKDVIYFNPADTEYPIAFNPMEVTDPKLRTHTVSELIGVLKRMFDSWGPRLEYILRYCLLALLEYPDATMLDITRLLTDKKFRREVMGHVSDPVVRNFWNVEFASWNDKFAAEAVAPVLNKVGAFTANPLVRNIIGQPKSSFNVRKIMDERKILIVNLSRGLVGEDNAALLGALMVTKIQLGSMSRADVPADQRAPFYLYVDEFQNFATDSFATILSEARKYGLNLTVANQYIAQMSQEVRDAVFGNVGSMIAFRMGADDARGMQRYFEPKFEEYDLIHMHNRHFVIGMTIDGEKSPAFSAISLDLPPIAEDNSSEIINHSRSQYALGRQEVEDYIQNRYHLTASVASLPGVPAQKQKIQNKEPSVTTAPISNSQSPEREAEISFSPEIMEVRSEEKLDKLLSIPEITSKLAKTIVKQVSSDSPKKTEKTKRKRTRRRKRKSTEPSLPVPITNHDTLAEKSAPAQKPKPQEKPTDLNEGTIIFKR